MRTLNIFAIACLLENATTLEAFSRSKVPSSLSTSPLFQLRTTNKRYKNELNTIGSNLGYSHTKNILSKSPLFTKNLTLQRAATSSTVPESSPTTAETPVKKKRASIQELREQGGIFSFDTPIGALNLYATAYALVAIGLGFVWYAATMMWKLIHFLSGKRFDKMVRFLVSCPFSHCLFYSGPFTYFNWPSMGKNSIVRT